MSERGIEIHNGKIVIPGSQMRQMQLGTWASPLTQTLAAQVLVSAVVNAIALGGAVHGGYFGVKASVNLTGDLRGVRARVTVNDGITVTGSTYGAVIEVEALGDGVVSGYYEGLRIEMYNEASTTVASVYGIFIANSISGTTGSYSFIRMSENGTATVRSIFHVSRGGLCTDMLYMFELSGSNPSAWDGAGSVSGQAGWLRILVGAEVRYITLYADKP